MEEDVNQIIFSYEARKIFSSKLRNSFVEEKRCRMKSVFFARFSCWKKSGGVPKNWEGLQADEKKRRGDESWNKKRWEKEMESEAYIYISLNEIMNRGKRVLKFSLLLLLRCAGEIFGLAKRLLYLFFWLHPPSRGHCLSEDWDEQRGEEGERIQLLQGKYIHIYISS